MTISLYLLICFLAALFLVIFSGKSSRLSLVVNLTQGGCMFLLLLGFRGELQEFQLRETITWFPSLGLNFSVGVDALSLSLIALSSMIALVIGVFIQSRSSEIGLVLFCHTAVVGALVALDLLLFFIFFELMLVPIYFLILRFGASNRVAAAGRFIIYSAFGSLFLFASFLLITSRGFIDGGAFDSSLLGAMSTSPGSIGGELLLFAGCLIAFMVKVPIFPFHAWQPVAYREAPTSATVMMAAVLSKVGIYGVIRFAFPIFPSVSLDAGVVLAWAGSLSAVIGALCAWRQSDMKRLLAFSSLSHLSLCFLGVAAWNATSLSAVAFQLVAHGIVTAGLFLIVGYLQDKTGRTDSVYFSGMAKSHPRIALLFVLLMLSSIALPLTAGFIGEFLILAGSYRMYPTATVVAMLTVVLGAVYSLQIIRVVFFGPIRDELQFADLCPRRSLVLALLVVALFSLGIRPQPLLELFDSSVRGVMISASERKGLKNRQVPPISNGKMQVASYVQR